MKNIYQANYNKHSFFKYVYDNEYNYNDEKKTIVNDSIDKYLMLIYSHINIDEINKKIFDSQNNKEYMLYKNGFRYQKNSYDKLKIVSTVGFKYTRDKKYRNGIIFKTVGCNNIEFLLRWKNHIGILYPAWQIKLK